MYLCSRFEKGDDDSLAQQVEHIPFKDGVLGSSPRWITKGKSKILKNKKASEIVDIQKFFYICFTKI